MTINIHIDQLILNNIDIEPAHKTQLKAYIEAELARHFLIHGNENLERKNFDIHSVLRSSMVINNRTSTAVLGQSIGNAIYTGLQK